MSLAQEGNADANGAPATNHTDDAIAEEQRQINDWAASEQNRLNNEHAAQQYTLVRATLRNPDLDEYALTDAGSYALSDGFLWTGFRSADCSGTAAVCALSFAILYYVHINHHIQSYDGNAADVACADGATTRNAACCYTAEYHVCIGVSHLPQSIIQRSLGYSGDQADSASVEAANGPIESRNATMNMIQSTMKPEGNPQMHHQFGHTPLSQISQGFPAVMFVTPIHVLFFEIPYSL